MNPKTKKMLKENILAIVVFYAIVSTPMYIYALVVQDEIIGQREWDLNVSQTAFKIQSESVKRLKYRIEELQSANTALMQVLDKKGCIKAIKNTPLPKMEIK